MAGGEAGGEEAGGEEAALTGRFGRREARRTGCRLDSKVVL